MQVWGGEVGDSHDEYVDANGDAQSGQDILGRRLVPVRNFWFFPVNLCALVHVEGDIRGDHRRGIHTGRLALVCTVHDFVNNLPEQHGEQSSHIPTSAPFKRSSQAACDQDKQNINQEECRAPGEEGRRRQRPEMNADVEDFGQHERDKDDRKKKFSRSSPTTIDIRLRGYREKNRWPVLFTKTV